MKISVLVSSIAASLCLSACVTPTLQPSSSADGDSGGQKTAAKGSSQSATKPGQKAGATENIDYTKMLSKTMTARQLFAEKGMYATLNLAQRMAADAKAGKNGMMMDSMGALTLDLGSTLRLASRLTASYLSYSALEQMMGSFSNNPAIMDTVTLDVPQIGPLNLQLQEDLLGVARFLAAMKASNMLVIESEKSLEVAKARYSQVLLERDEKAATLGKANFLVNGVFQLSESQLKATSGQSLEYLKSFYGKPIEETLKDKQAAHLIDTELRARFPKEYKSIISGEKEVASHYSEYAKTSVGTLSMLGFASIFISNVVDMSSQSDGHKLLLLPMAKDGVVELVGIVKNVISAISRNDDLVEGTFSVTVDGKTTTGIQASKVLKTLSEDQLNGFRNALIGNESRSYLARLDRQSINYAADIMDRLADRDAKEAFATKVLSLENPDTFSFKTAFAANSAVKATKAKGVDTSRVKRKLYEENLETSADDTGLAFGKLQTVVKKDVTNLTNQDLRRIMLLGDQKESLAIGNAIVRLEQPGLQGLADQVEMRSVASLKVTQDVGKAVQNKVQSKTAKSVKAVQQSVSEIPKLPPKVVAGKPGTPASGSK